MARSSTQKAPCSQKRCTIHTAFPAPWAHTVPASVFGATFQTRFCYSRPQYVIFLWIYFPVLGIIEAARRPQAKSLWAKNALPACIFAKRRLDAMHIFRYNKITTIERV